MYCIEAVSNLVFLFATAIANVAIEASKNLYSLKSIVVVISAALSLYINAVWIKRVNLKKHLIVPIVYLTVVNLISIATSIEIEIFFSFDIALLEANILCKFLKWIQSTSIIMSTGLIIYIINIFCHPQTFQSKIKEKIRLILIITPILTFPQVMSK